MLSRQAFFFELTLYDILCGDTRMIRARYPKGLQALHAFPPNEDVLKGIIEGMSDMEGARNVWRWNDDTK